MISLLALLSLVVSLSCAEQLPGCIENNNSGVFNEFGPLPADLTNKNAFCQVLKLDQTNPRIPLTGRLDNYELEYFEYKEMSGLGRDFFGYLKIYFKNNGEVKLLDYLRVNPMKWHEVENAILEADLRVAVNGNLRIKFMTSRCECVTREYSLLVPDIVSSAKTLTCSGSDGKFSPHKLPYELIDTKIKLSNMAPHEKFPGCEEGNNYGIFPEFGRIPQDIYKYKYKKVPRKVTKTKLYGNLDKFSFYILEFRETGRVGPGSYMYLQVYYDDEGDTKLVDYIRVDPDKWQIFQLAVLDTDIRSGLTVGRKLRIKYLTSDCTCIMRVHNLKQEAEVMEDAVTMGCDEATLLPKPHLLAIVPDFTSMFELHKLGPQMKFAGCDDNNYGIFNDFRPLPNVLQDPDLYYQVVSTCDPETSFQFQDRSSMFKVDYFEFREQFDIGSATYAYHKLKYKYRGNHIFLDYLRVNPKYWKQIQTAVLRFEHDLKQDYMLRVKYLLTDCSCLMRVYNLNDPDVNGGAKTLACNGQPFTADAAVRSDTSPQVQPDVKLLGENDKCPGCDEKQNFGVFAEFGPLPADLHDENTYCELLKLDRSHTKITLKGKFKNYMLEYFEFKKQLGHGTEVFSYHTLYFDDNGKMKLLDIMRVDPQKWHKAENAVLEADSFPATDKTLRVKFLLSDCRCVMRVYNLGFPDVLGRASTEACNGAQMSVSSHVIPQPQMQFSHGKKLTNMATYERFLGCDKENNFGVISQFGTLPKELFGSKYYKVTDLGQSTNVIQLSGSLEKFQATLLEFQEVNSVGPVPYVYLALRYNDDGSYRLLDYVRVIPEKWKNIQKAILSTELRLGFFWSKNLRIRYLTTGCTCIMRSYDLKANDIVSKAVTLGCDDATKVAQNRHKIAGVLIPYTDPGQINKLGAREKYSGCGENNYGVLNEFGPLPSALQDPKKYFPVLSTCYSQRSYQLTGVMQKYRVEYSEFKEQYGFGARVYAYNTLYYNYGGSLKILDYLRVNPKNWRHIQIAILKIEQDDSANNILRIRYLLSDCTCVMRMYDLSSHDISALAKTMACTGAPLTHEDESTSTKLQLTRKPQTALLPLGVKYEGCKGSSNYGVINEFGALPQKLYDDRLYFKIRTGDYSYTRFQLNGNLEKYNVEYSEFRNHDEERPDVYGYHTLYYNDEGKTIMLDFVRVNPNRMKQVQRGILNADHHPDSKKYLRICYLLSDCTSIMRVYNLKAQDVSGTATVLPCSGTTFISKQTPKSTKTLPIPGELVPDVTPSILLPANIGIQINVEPQGIEEQKPPDVAAQVKDKVTSVSKVGKPRTGSRTAEQNSPTSSVFKSPESAISKPSKRPAKKPARVGPVRSAIRSLRKRISRILSGPPH